MMALLRRMLAGSLLVLLALTGAGCGGSDLKGENDALKKQVADLQKQSGDLRGQVDALAKENDSLKKQVAEMQAKTRPGAAAKPGAAGKPAGKPAPKK